MIDRYGRLDWDERSMLDQAEAALAAGMTSPVRCAFCRRIYDLGTVEVTARYIDCSMWTTPCCRREADDRGETGWKSRKDYYPLGKGYA